MVSTHRHKEAGVTSTYNDLLVRDALGDNGTIPYPGSVTWQSPDILPAGINPVKDPQIFFTNNYNQFYYGDIQFGWYNYIYVRVKNLASSPLTGQVALYYIQSNIFSLPRQWISQRVPNINHTNLGTFGLQTPIQPGAVGVIDTPFYWNVPSLPVNGYHYCLLAQIITDAHPNPIPVTDDMFNFDTWIRSNGGAAFRNVSVINNQPNTSQQWLVDMVNPDTAASHLYVIVAQCTNVPVGSTVSMVSPTVGPQPPVNYSESITNSTLQNVTTSTTLPPNFQAQLVVTYTPNGSAPNAQILISYYIATTGDLLDTITPTQYTTTPRKLGADHKRLGLEENAVLVLLGDFTYATKPTP